MEEASLVLFLAFTSLTLIINTFMIWFAYKAFAKVTKSLVEFQPSGATKAWIATLHTAMQHAADASEATRRQLIEFDPVLERAQQKYAVALSAIDSKLEGAEAEITVGARRARDIIAKPAFSIMTMAAGVSNALSSWEPEDER